MRQGWNRLEIIFIPKPKLKPREAQTNENKNESAARVAATPRHRHQQPVKRRARGIAAVCRHAATKKNNGDWMVAVAALSVNGGRPPGPYGTIFTAGSLHAPLFSSAGAIARTRHQIRAPLVCPVSVRLLPLHDAANCQLPALGSVQV